MAQSWSKQRLSPMLRDTPVLNGKVKDVRTKGSSNTILEKVFHERVERTALQSGTAVVDHDLLAVDGGLRLPSGLARGLGEGETGYGGESERGRDSFRHHRYRTPCLIFSVEGSTGVRARLSQRELRIQFVEVPARAPEAV
jgi:hypothetical protein